MQIFCYNRTAMNDLSKILQPLTFINTPYTRETFDMTDYHKHNTLELVYIASGYITMSYYEDKREQPKAVTVRENQFIVIQPGVEHFQCVPTNAHMMVLELRHTNPNISVTSFLLNSNFVALIPVAKNVLQKMDCVNIFTDVHDVKRIFNKVLNLLYNNQHDKTDEYFPAYYELNLKQLFIEIFKCINTNMDPRYNRYVQYVLSFIQKNFGNDISIKQIAENLDLSPVYLNSVFKKEIGQSIQEHLISVRIEKAQKLLAEQNLAISAISKKVGYKNLRSFEMAFLKVVGVSPTEYQKQHKLGGFVLWKHHQDGSIAVDIEVNGNKK